MEFKFFIKSHFHKELHSIDVCVKGWNWGDLEFQDSLMSFNNDSKAAFQVPNDEVSQVIPCYSQHICLFVAFFLIMKGGAKLASRWGGEPK